MDPTEPTPGSPPREVCVPSVVDGTLLRLVSADGRTWVERWIGSWVRDDSGFRVADVLMAPPAGPATLTKFGVV
jgi:hypothetical protein